MASTAPSTPGAPHPAQPLAPAPRADLRPSPARRSVGSRRESRKTLAGSGTVATTLRRTRQPLVRAGGAGPGSTWRSVRGPLKPHIPGEVIRDLHNDDTPGPGSEQNGRARGFYTAAGKSIGTDSWKAHSSGFSKAQRGAIGTRSTNPNQQPGPAEYGRLLDSFAKQSEAGRRTGAAHSFGRAGRFATHRKQHLGKGFDSERLGAESLGPAAYQRPPEDSSSVNRRKRRPKTGHGKGGRRSRGRSGSASLRAPFSPVAAEPSDDVSTTRARPGSAHPSSSRRAKGVDGFGPQVMDTRRTGVSHSFPTASREGAARAVSTRQHMDRSANKDALQSPAPGSYMVRSSIKYYDSQPRGASFGTEKRLQSAHEMSRYEGRALDRTRLGVESPGPGQYALRDGIAETARQRQSKRSISPRTSTLGSARRFQQTSRERESADLPGPGEYDDFVSGAIGDAEGRRGALDAVEEEEAQGVAERDALGSAWVIVAAAEKADAHAASHRNGRTTHQANLDDSLARSNLRLEVSSLGSSAHDPLARAALRPGQRVRPGAAIRPFSAKPSTGAGGHTDGQLLWGAGHGGNDAEYEEGSVLGEEREASLGGGAGATGVSARRRGTLRRRSPRDSYSTIVGVTRVSHSSPPRGRRTPGLRFGTSTREHPILFGAPGNVLFEQPTREAAVVVGARVRPATATAGQRSGLMETWHKSSSRAGTVKVNSARQVVGPAPSEAGTVSTLPAARPASAVRPVVSPRMVRVRAKTVFGTSYQIRR